MKKPRETTHPHRVQAGVALLEVLVAVLLFSLGLLGLIGLQARAVSFSVDAEDRNRAALLANEVVALMWLNQSTTVPAATLAAWKTRVSTPTTGGLPSGVGTVTPVGTGKAADVTITWQAPSSSTSSKLTTHVELPQ
ncbi:type IV pilus assembly protein PilV [Variovorax sp. SG517]|uniref:type IV pilus modification protein PilV n=1 Tax=Variovorax sp. SG517 TaxID=2587117 RepID=UPI00159D9BD2|nr:type IV pilus modification protein PilV [Variovorax sp. SG517]NVM89226.1 type IV pilus assembly protein PilV [Variovorax sp. SG517]